MSYLQKHFHYSFDIASIINSQEVKNAVNLAEKELLHRYDLNGTNPPESEKDGDTKFRKQWNSLVQEVKWLEGHFNDYKNTVRERNG